MNYRVLTALSYAIAGLLVAPTLIAQSSTCKLAAIDRSDFGRCCKRTGWKMPKPDSNWLFPQLILDSN